jgi:thiol-disulfide isomerase/thioredoxin
MKKLNLLLVIAAFTFILGGAFLNGQSQKSSNQNPPVGIQIGNVAPELILSSPDGKEIKLSSLRGKVVLIDFWASWCGPCRKSNPELVKLYAKFKSKGFTIYSVSLDSDKEAWKGAIKADGLSWPNHVSDLKQWKTPLISLYNLSSIPFTVLVNKKGDIVGTNLHGAQLESKISQIL